MEHHSFIRAHPFFLFRPFLRQRLKIALDQKSGVNNRASLLDLFVPAPDKMVPICLPISPLVYALLTGWLMEPIKMGFPQADGWWVLVIVVSIPYPYNICSMALLVLLN